MTGGRSLRGAAAAGFLAGLLLAAPAWAGGPAPASATNGGDLVRGGAPVPDFHVDLASPGLVLGEPRPTTDAGHLEISLGEPDTGVLSFLFSPRPQFGASLDRTTGTSRSYLGLSWDMFRGEGFFGSVGIAGSLTRPGAEEPSRSLLGPPVALHGTLELGYRMGDQHSLTLSVDRARTTELGTGGGELGDNLRLRYGLRF
jgi:hypothetical protein